MAWVGEHSQTLLETLLATAPKHQDFVDTWSYEFAHYIPSRLRADGFGCSNGPELRRKLKGSCRVLEGRFFLFFGNFVGL